MSRQNIQSGLGSDHIFSYSHSQGGWDSFAPCSVSRYFDNLKNTTSRNKKVSGKVGN